MKTQCNYCLRDKDTAHTTWHWVRLKAKRRGFTKKSVCICDECAKFLFRGKDYITGKDPNAPVDVFDDTAIEEHVKYNTIYYPQIRDTPYQTSWRGERIVADTKGGLVAAIVAYEKRRSAS